MLHFFQKGIDGRLLRQFIKIALKYDQRISMRRIDCRKRIFNTAAAHEAELFRAQATEPLFDAAPEDRAKEADAIRAPRRLSEPRLEETYTLSETPPQGNFFARWFRTRVRGGAK